MASLHGKNIFSKFDPKSLSIFFKYTLPAHAFKSVYYSLIHCHDIWAASLG